MAKLAVGRDVREVVRETVDRLGRTSDAMRTVVEETRARLATKPKRAGSLLTIQEVVRRTSLSRATIYRLEQAGEFPKRVQLSRGRVAWREAEVEAWDEQRQRVRADSPTPAAPRPSRASARR